MEKYNVKIWVWEKRFWDIKVYEINDVMELWGFRVTEYQGVMVLEGFES